MTISKRGRGFFILFLFNKYQEKCNGTHTVRDNRILKGYENKYCSTFNSRMELI